MNSRIYVGEVMHARLRPVRHVFRYPLYWYAFDLDELPELDRQIPGFGYNRLRPVSVHDRDYLTEGDAPIRDKVLALLRRCGIDEPGGRIELVTAARYLHYVFNPVSFHFCRRPDGTVAVVVAEVNNTFGERHVYILDHPEGPPGAWPLRYRAGKAFHVSPFNDRRGDYTFEFHDPSREMDFRIHLERDGERIMTARLHGAPRPLTAGTLVRTVARYPLAAALSVPRITWQAARLYFQRGLPVHTRPDPNSPMTIGRRPPGAGERICRRLVAHHLRRIAAGRFELALPDGSVDAFGDPAAPAPVRLELRNWRLFPRLVSGGDIGFGESYSDGDWDCADLTGVIRLFIRNRAALAGGNTATALASRLLNRLRHGRRRNTLLGSRENIRDHYDLSNDLYRLFLDESMMYSCALFDQPSLTLEEAQRRKIQLLLEKAAPGPDDHILEIGSGWGAFAIAAARETGCRVTSITLSEEQLALARERVRAAGLADRVAVELCDYRHVDGRFDRIVSIEMLEAVGHAYLGTFFARLDQLLKPGGWAVIQVITIPDQRYDAYRRQPDWIQKHIFPGGMLPSLAALGRAMKDHSELVVQDLENIGAHYAPTLAEWRRRFLANAPAVRALGFDDAFIRKWVYYFSYCEGAFAERYLNDLHLVLARPGAPQAPWERHRCP
jgi:cyclopropane-fatty-acyl-phospholipid synthase